ncbi:hypothetical protein [Megamonas sp.]|uniref:hypothetical protein n=1 Tax=Megamonas sp. TaxID=2049033 RepID=UPI002584567F|nr:hypothetical protein [Megamonas sp.]
MEGPFATRVTLGATFTVCLLVSCFSSTLASISSTSSGAYSFSAFPCTSLHFYGFSCLSSS